MKKITVSRLSCSLEVW